MHEGNQDLPRRGLLRALGVLAGGFALSGCERKDPYRIEKPDVPGAARWTRGEERGIASACGQCGAACGIVARVVEGRAVKIEGNPSSPMNRGGIGARGLAGTQALYDPDRVLAPLRRRAPRGAPAGEDGFEPVAWDVALDEIGARLAALREGGGAHRVAVIAGKDRGLTADLLRRFARAFGTPMVVDGSAASATPIAAAALAMQGIPEEPAYDWRGARCVLSLGTDALDGACHVASLARSGPGPRAKVVHVGPVRTRTAVNADEHVVIRPQTYGAFALGVAHVLVREGLEDAAFLAEHAHGFEAWEDAEGRAHQGFKDVLAAYAPERAGEICGVPPGEIERVARALAAARPAFAIGGAEELRGSNGLGAAMAIHALNAVLGAIDRPGGVLTQRRPPLAELPEIELDEIAEEGLARRPGGALTARGELAVDRFPEACLEAAEPPDVLMLYYSNPLYARAGEARWRAALERVPCVVGFSPQLDETCDAFADWILPDVTYLERWEDAGAGPSVGHPVFVLRQPVVEPLGEARATADVLIALASRCGESVQAALAFADAKDAVKKQVVGIYKAKRGSIVEESGATFLSRLYAEGVWSDPTYEHERWDEVLRTPSGKLELFSTALWERAARLADELGVAIDDLPAALGREGPVDLLCLPRHEEPRLEGEPERFPLLLAPYRPKGACEGGGANLPWLWELKPHAGRAMWTTEVEVNPRTAREHGLGEGTRARVASESGWIEAPVHLDAGVPPSIVRIAQGGGHTACGRFARGVGANVMRLVGLAASDPLSGASPLQGTRVSIERVGS